jgi:NAD(P)H-hydrate epimerase
MREWETATWKSGQTEAAVIARVGEQLARHVLAITKPGGQILILAGKGHNGDDGRAMRRHLRGRKVTCLEVHVPSQAGRKLPTVLQARPEIIVDALFGIGLCRPLDADWVAFINRVNESGIPILAVDVPSGLNADTGEPQPVAIRATETATVGAAKRGLLTTHAAEFVGRLVVLTDVGLVPCPCAAECHWTLPEDFAALPWRRAVHSHKGTFGHLGIIAGSLGFHGASVLAARGAQRARPGLITLFTQKDIYSVVAAPLQAVMVPVWAGELEFSQFTALLFGPGLAAKRLPASVRAATGRAWKAFPGPVIVDASALDWLPRGTFANGATRVLTPHPGEAARLLGVTTAEVQRDRVTALRQLSKRFGGAWVVLKGHQTLIGREAGDVFVNSSGTPGLAQGGSGDVLAGFLAALLAQSGWQMEALRTIRYAVWEHGAAGERLDRVRTNWLIEELAEELARVMP